MSMPFASHVRPEVSEPDRRHRVMLPNHHLAKPVLIGEIQEDGQFDIISQTEEVPGDAWTDFLPESAVLKSDWKELGCGMYNTETDLRADPVELLSFKRRGGLRAPLPFCFKP
jgi:hypothetical protein